MSLAVKRREGKSDAKDASCQRHGKRTRNNNISLEFIAGISAHERACATTRNRTFLPNAFYSDFNEY